MQGGDIILTPLPQADGEVKNRPALVLCRMRPFDDLMVCGISTQARLQVSDFDEFIGQDAPDFVASGLAVPSLIRLGFVSTVAVSAVKGRIGSVDQTRYRKLVARLVDYLSRAANR